MVNTNQEFIFRPLDFVGKLKSGFVHEKSNRFRFSAETKLRVETLLLTMQKSKQRLTIGSEKSGMEVTNRQRSNEFAIGK